MSGQSRCAPLDQAPETNKEMATCLFARYRAFQPARLSEERLFRKKAYVSGKICKRAESGFVLGAENLLEDGLLVTTDCNRVGQAIITHHAEHHHQKAHRITRRACDNSKKLLLMCT